MDYDDASKYWWPAILNTVTLADLDDSERRGVNAGRVTWRQARIMARLLVDPDMDYHGGGWRDVKLTPELKRILTMLAGPYGKAVFKAIQINQQVTDDV